MKEGYSVHYKWLLNSDFLSRRRSEAQHTLCEMSSCQGLMLRLTFVIIFFKLLSFITELRFTDLTNPEMVPRSNRRNTLYQALVEGVANTEIADVLPCPRVNLDQQLYNKFAERAVQSTLNE